MHAHTHAYTIPDLFSPYQINICVHPETILVRWSYDNENTTQAAVHITDYRCFSASVVFINPHKINSCLSSNNTSFSHNLITNSPCVVLAMDQVECFCHCVWINYLMFNSTFSHFSIFINIYEEQHSNFVTKHLVGHKYIIHSSK